MHTENLQDSVMIHDTEKHTIHHFGEKNCDKTVNTKTWWILLWQMPKIAKTPKIMIICQFFTGQLESLTIPMAHD